MKRFTIIIFFLLSLPVFAAAEGPAVGLIFGDPSGITLKFGRFPVIGFGWSGIYGRGQSHINLDYWIINNRLDGDWWWYLGVGAKLRAWGSSRLGGFALGARVPVGLQWKFAPRWEIHLEGAPGIVILPPAEFWWDAGIGIRYYIGD